MAWVNKISECFGSFFPAVWVGLLYFVFFNNSDQNDSFLTTFYYLIPISWNLNQKMVFICIESLLMKHLILLSFDILCLQFLDLLFDVEKLSHLFQVTDTTFNYLVIKLEKVLFPLIFFLLPLYRKWKQSQMHCGLL